MRSTPSAEDTAIPFLNGSFCFLRPIDQCLRRVKGGPSNVSSRTGGRRLALLIASIRFEFWLRTTGSAERVPGRGEGVPCALYQSVHPQIARGLQTGYLGGDY